MTFSAPLALVLLVVLPYLIWLGRPLTQRNAVRAWASVVVRCLIVLLLVFSLAGSQVVRAADELAVVFLVDASDSIQTTTRQAALDWVQEAIQSLKPQDKAAVVLFGANAVVERPLSMVSELAPVTSEPYSLNTDIGAAIRLGLALLPAGSARRIVILSDGIETLGDAAANARIASAAGAQIDVVPLSSIVSGEEILLTSVSSPTHLTQGDTLNLVVTAERRGAEGAQPLPAVLRVIGNERVVYEKPVALDPGENNFTIPLVAGDPGFARYKVQIEPAVDGFYQNNELSAYTEIVGPPRVLLVAPPDEVDSNGETVVSSQEETTYLAQALLASGIQVDRVDITRLPVDLAALNDYAAVVLVDVNAKDASRRKLALLQNYVRDLGGGLVVTGGPESYGPGGYYKTPLEEILPVEMQLKDQERRISLTMYFVIDKSGSMSDTSVGGVPKVELAKEAVIRSLELLGLLDRAAVVAFDDSAFWVVQPQEVVDPDEMSNLVGSIRAGGGTDIYAGLLAVSEIIPDDDSTLKHVILLTDGGASETGNPELAEKLYQEYGATLSVVAIGEGFSPWITRLPELAGGRFHFAYDPETIPEIFTQETTLATRAYIIEETFWPSLVQQHPILNGITAVPPLLGYIGTTPKPAAQLILTTNQDDPLLAAWRYGLGKSVAWTSDATGRWAVEWVGWEGFARFWEQAVKWTISQERDTNVETEVTMSGGRGIITVDASDAEGGFINELSMETRVVGPDNDAFGVEMHQIAPGRYQGSFKPDNEGAYLIRIAGGADQVQVAQSTGWVLSYSPEYRITNPDPALLQNLAQLTGGKELSEPWESLSHDLAVEKARRPIWNWLTLAAILLFPIDVALRRLAVGKREMEKAWSVVQTRLHVKRRERETVPRSEPVSRLMQAKQRASQPPGKPPTPGSFAPVVLPDEKETPTPPKAEAVPTRPASPEAGDGMLANRLLSSKKHRESKEKDSTDHGSNSGN